MSHRKAASSGEATVGGAVQVLRMTLGGAYPIMLRKVTVPYSADADVVWSGIVVELLVPLFIEGSMFRYMMLVHDL